MSTRIYRACDRCETLGIDAPGEPRGPFMGRTIDLCAECWDEVAKPLVALVEDRGVPVDGKTRRGPYKARKAPQTAEPAPVVVSDPDHFTCPLCGAMGLTKDSWSRHLHVIHQISSVDLWGDTCPVCGETTGRWGPHIRRHADLGARRVADAFEWARVNGDPHGVYARQIAPRRVS